jgi:hypothetical protein
MQTPFHMPSSPRFTAPLTILPPDQFSYDEFFPWPPGISGYANSFFYYTRESYSVSEPAGVYWQWGGSRELFHGG